MVTQCTEEQGFSAFNRYMKEVILAGATFSRSQKIPSSAELLKVQKFCPLLHLITSPDRYKALVLSILDSPQGSAVKWHPYAFANPSYIIYWMTYSVCFCWCDQMWRHHSYQNKKSCDHVCQSDQKQWCGKKANKFEQGIWGETALSGRNIRGSRANGIKITNTLWLVSYIVRVCEFSNEYEKFNTILVLCLRCSKTIKEYMGIYWVVLLHTAWLIELLGAGRLIPFVMLTIHWMVSCWLLIIANSSMLFLK